MYFFTLASSSSGNCALACAGETRLLIDAGLSAARLEKALWVAGERPEKLTAILLTHEHIDHVNGVARLAFKYGLPVYATPKTWANLPGAVEAVPDYLQKTYSYDLTLGDFQLDFCKTSHDAVQPVGLVLQAEGRRLAYITDTGCVTRGMLAALSQPLDGLILEANHDQQMLLHGPYPYHLKRRVSGEQGHLANGQAAELLRWYLGRNGLCRIMLAHLSETNNTPQLAYDSAAAVLADLLPAEEMPQWLCVAPAKGQSEVWRFE